MTATVSDGLAPARTAPLALVEFLRYFFSSALAFAVDYATYGLALRLGVAYPVAAAAGFVAGVTTAYLLSVRWVFRRRSVANAQVEFLLFLAIGVVGLALTEALLWLQIGMLGAGPMVAKLCAAGVVFLFNFGVRKAVLFTRGTRTGA